MIDWWRKIICNEVVNHTFSRIKTGNHHTFSRIPPCTLCWIQKVHPQKSFTHPSNIQQISLSLYKIGCGSAIPSLKNEFLAQYCPRLSLSLLTTKSAKGLHTREAKQRLWIHRKYEKAQKATGIASFKPKQKLEPLLHHEFSAETGSRVTRTQHLNHRSANRWYSIAVWNCIGKW